MDVPTKKSGQAHHDAEQRREHRQHNEPALLSQSRHRQERDRQRQHRVREIKLIIMKIELVVSLISLVGVGLLSLLFFRLLLSKGLVSFDLFLEERFSLRWGGGCLGG